MMFMLTKEDIEHLATLARISVSEDEKAQLAGQIDAVLEYVSAVSGVVTERESAPVAGELRNVMREDDGPYAGGEWSEAILANAPHKEDRYFKVEQIM
jgi:aspartyl-tRNA(Asn)/glutamyl-tRNA(Gln) amidotransferase subunit C